MICKSVPLSMLRPGAVLSTAINDPTDRRVKLLSQGTAITQAFIDRLYDRGIEMVILSQRDIATLTAFQPQGRRIKVPPPPNYVTSRKNNDHAEAIDTHVMLGGELKVSDNQKPYSHSLTKPVDVPYADGLAMEWAAESNERIDTVTQFFADTVADRSTDIGPLRATCHQLLDRLAEDADALVCLACTPYEADYPTRHGVHLATLAMAIGMEMELGKNDLIELGLGCLIHDIGMQAVGINMFDTGKPLSDGQLRRLADHPVRAIEIAGGYDHQFSALAQFVIYQIHERGDGSGYPRGMTIDKIHPLARIAAVADAFIGMLTNRKHRLAIVGYYAVTSILNDAMEKKFDSKVVRGLLRATSLYPLGSEVRLNSGVTGRVIRSGGDDFARPTIELSAGRDVINLRHERDLRIVETVQARAA